MQNKKKFRIWHNSCFGNSPFIVEVSSVKEAKKVLKIIQDYDNYQCRVRNDDYFIVANASGLEFWDTEVSEWVEWCDEFGDHISEIMKQEE